MSITDMLSIIELQQLEEDAMRVVLTESYNEILISDSTYNENFEQFLEELADGDFTEEEVL